MKKIRNLILFFVGIMVAIRELIIHEDRKELKRITDDRDKLAEINRVWYMWSRYRSAGKNVSEFFAQNGYKKVAIYGMKELGVALFNELRSQNIEVAYGIDKNDEAAAEGLRVYSPDDSLEDVDVVVVTPIHYFNEIAEKLNGKMTCPIISIENIFANYS